MIALLPLLILFQIKKLKSHLTNRSPIGHGGISHGNYPDHLNVTSHHNGIGTHFGDTGKNNILFTNDIIHHGGGGVFVSMGNGPTRMGVPGALSIDDIHHKMSDAMADAHNASIASKEAARQAEILQASIAAERSKQKEEELAVLKDLDNAAARQEHLRPEVLGKMSIPVATFTQESFPLFHHVRDLLSKIKAIQNTEAKAIQAQQTITRLDDITDQVRLQDVALQNPHAYHNFMDAGNVQPFLMAIPVLDAGGDFYLSNTAGAGNVHTHDIPVKEHIFPDGHSHFSDHGDIVNPDLGAGGKLVGAKL